MRYTTRIIVPPRIRRSGAPGSPGGAYGPQVLGVRKTLGFGDRLGLAAAGHVAFASRHPEFAPILAQISAGEMSMLGKLPGDVVGAASRAVGAARFRQPWGADADRLRDAQEVAGAAGAGFTYFTLDASEFVRANVDQMSDTQLASAVDTLVAEGELPENWFEPYLDRTIDLSDGHRLQISLAPLSRAALRYASAVQHCARLSAATARANQGRPFELEVALDAAEAVASPLEHLFVGLELEARGVRLTSLALRFVDETAPDAIASTLLEHAAVADFCGPYKMCFHDPAEGSAILPLLGRTCKDAFHVKVSAVSYLEALRVIMEVDPEALQEIASFGLNQAAEPDVLDEPEARKRLAEASPAVLTTGRTQDGQPFKQVITEQLDRHAELYAERLINGYERLLAPVFRGLMPDVAKRLRPTDIIR